MSDPIIAADGYSYERGAIQDWIQRRLHSETCTSPVNGAPLVHTFLTPNHTLRHVISEIVQDLHSIAPIPEEVDGMRTIDLSKEDDGSIYNNDDISIPQRLA